MEEKYCDCEDSCGCKTPQQYELVGLWDDYTEKVEDRNLCRVGDELCEACQ